MTSPPLSPSLRAGGPETGNMYGVYGATHSGPLHVGRHVESSRIFPPEHTTTSYEPCSESFEIKASERIKQHVTYLLRIPSAPNLACQRSLRSKRFRGLDRRPES